jgi:hypothetical protein
VDSIKWMNFVLIAIFAASIVWLRRGDKAAGHWRTVTWMFIGATSMSWMEAVWDWVLYYRINPAVLWLMPSSLPVLGMAGGLSYVIVAVYGPWFVLCTYFFAKKLVDYNLSTSAIVICALVAGALAELVLEIPFLFTNTYSYTRSIPGADLFRGTQQQYPLEVPLLMAPVMAFFTFMMVRGLRGANPASKPASALGRLGALRAFGGADDRPLPNLVAAVASSNLFFFLVMIPALLIRFAGWRTEIGSAAPFGFPAYPFPY